MLSPFWPLLGQKQSKIFAKKNHFRSTLQLYVAVTSCEKFEIFQVLIFRNIQKASFCAHVGLLLPKKPRARFFSKNRAPSLKLYAKNQKISASGFGEKRRTNGQTDKHRGSCIGPSRFPVTVPS